MPDQTPTLAAAATLIRKALLFFEHMAAHDVCAGLEDGRIDPQDELMSYASAAGIADKLDNFGEVTEHAIAAYTAPGMLRALEIIGELDWKTASDDYRSRMRTSGMRIYKQIVLDTIRAELDQSAPADVDQKLAEAFESIESDWPEDSAIPPATPDRAAVNVVGMSADVDDSRTLKLHFRAPFTDRDRKRLLDAINATPSGNHPVGVDVDAALLRNLAINLRDMETLRYRSALPFGWIVKVADKLDEIASRPAPSPSNDVRKAAESACWHYWNCGPDNACGVLPEAMSKLAIAIGFDKNSIVADDIHAASRPAPSVVSVTEAGERIKVLEAALKRVEWCLDGDCPICMGGVEKHRPGCELASALGAKPRDPRQEADALEERSNG